MIEYKNLGDKELANYMVLYIDKIRSLMRIVSEYLSGNHLQYQAYIKGQYKKLKEEIKSAAHYVNLLNNENRKNKLYTYYFKQSIAETSAFGFRVPTNSKIQFDFYDSLEEAHYKLTKYKSYDEWKKLAE